MIGVSETYLIPYAIALGATSFEVAFLASIPALIAALVQVRSASVTQFIGSRTRLINYMVFFHALSWVPIIFIPYFMSLFGKSITIPWILLLAVTLFMSLGVFAVPVWQSLMSDYIPLNQRGKYFGWRNRLQGILTVSVSISAGLVLNHFGKDSVSGFIIIFTFAMVSRLFSWFCLTQMVEPFRHTTHDEYFSFIDFLKRMRTSNFARFVLLVSGISFSVNISGPLLNVFLLKDLHLSYAAFMFVVTTAAFSGFMFQSLWGSYADRFGNIQALKLSGWGIAVVPIFWLISHNLVYLFFVQMFAGFFWGGFNLLILNYMMEVLSPEKKIRAISYFNVMNTTAIFLGAALGGLIINHLPRLFGYSFLTLFLISCACRLSAVTFLGSRVKETRI